MKVDNYTVAGSSGRLMPVNLVYDETQKNQPIILFCHGFKGFKDWGAWNLMGNAFAKAGYVFISFNYSHNGGTVEQPIDFLDLEAFGKNNYSKEVHDTKVMLDWIEELSLPFDKDSISLLGHSRAGGITTIVASQDARIRSLITLASVADYQERFPTDLVKWKNEGVYYIQNGRTQQQMPLYYQFYQDWLDHKDELNILNAAKKLSIPHLVIHGDKDPTVLVSDAVKLSETSPFSELRMIQGADHVFGAKHPWKESYLPSDLRQVVQCSINWLKTAVEE